MDSGPIGSVFEVIALVRGVMPLSLAIWMDGAISDSQPTDARRGVCGYLNRQTSRVQSCRRAMESMSCRVGKSGQRGGCPGKEQKVPFASDGSRLGDTRAAVQQTVDASP